MTTRIPTTFAYLNEQARQSSVVASKLEKKCKVSEKRLHDYTDSLMESSNKLHAMGYSSIPEQIENTVDGVTTITLKVTLTPNNTPSTPESEELLKEVISKHAKCSKAMAVNRKLCEEYYKAEVEGYKNILLCYEKCAQSYGECGTLFLMRTKSEKSLKNWSESLVKLQTTRRYIELIVQR